MTLLAAASLWWTTIVLLRAGAGTPPPFVLAPGIAHALVMIGSFMPMYFAGFLCTAGPRWLQLPPVEAASLLPLVGGWIAGWTIFAAGAQLDLRVATAGLAIVALGWSAFVLRLVRMIVASPAPDRVHPLVITVACAAGAAAFWYAAWALAVGEPARLLLAESVLLGWFIGPVFVGALHRMVPFFHVASPALERRFGNAPLALLVGALALQPVVQAIVFSSNDPATARLVHALAFVVEAAMAALVAWLAWRWCRVQNLRIRLLAMLFAALAWLGVAFALRAADSFALALAHSVPGLRLAALHALTMGFFATTMLAMVSRVTCGQAGRLLSSEHVVWWLFLALQSATALRIAAEATPASPTPLVIAALAWSAAMLVWSLRYIGWYGRTRSDTQGR